MYELTEAQAAQVDKRGFVYIPGYLRESDLELLREGFRLALERDPNNDYFRIMPGEVLSKFQPMVQAISDSIRGAGITVDGVYGGGLYFANYAARPNPESKKKARGVAIGWHQDHDSYYMWQDHHNYLNVYIPIDKPDPDRSNLTVVPFDNLKARAPELCEKLLGRGAATGWTSNHGGFISDDERGGVIGRFDFDLAEIEETPSLKAGDLLLLRGDILHRTQDTLTQRVAVSFRLMNGQATISRKKLATGGFVKSRLMYNGRGAYKAIIRYFQRNRKNTVPIAEMAHYLGNIGPTPPSKVRPLTVGALLAWEKLRAFF